MFLILLFPFQQGEQLKSMREVEQLFLFFFFILINNQRNVINIQATFLEGYPQLMGDT